MNECERKNERILFAPNKRPNYVAANFKWFHLILNAIYQTPRIVNQKWLATNAADAVRQLHNWTIRSTVDADAESIRNAEIKVNDVKKSFHCKY